MTRLLMAVLMFFGWVPAVLAGPVIQVSPAEIDMGTLYAGQSSEQVFIIENRGDEPLIIQQVRTSCGCTSAFSRDKVVAPGTHTELAVRFNSKGFGGSVVKRVMLLTNDPSGKTELVLRAQVKRELAMEPSRIRVGMIPVGKSVEQTLTLKNLSDQPVERIAVRCTSRMMSVEQVPEKLAPGESVTLKLRVNGPEPANTPVNGYLLISGHGHVANQLRISVVGKSGGTP